LKRRLGLYGTAGQLQQRPAPMEGGLFQRGWFRTVPIAPLGFARRVRYWDLAASVEGDYTCGVLMSRDEDGIFYVEDVRRGQWSPAQRDKIIRDTALVDGQDVEIVLEQEPGSAGKSVIQYLGTKLAGYRLMADRPTGTKEVRAQPLASQCGISNVCLVKGAWHEAFLDELCVFPNGRHDDQVDAASGAFARLVRYPEQHRAPETAAATTTAPWRFGIQLDTRGDHAHWFRHRHNNRR
jgi:predicted phage terminase large subunit-like protein